MAALPFAPAKAELRMIIYQPQIVLIKVTHSTIKANGRKSHRFWSHSVTGPKEARSKPATPQRQTTVRHFFLNEFNLTFILRSLILYGAWACDNVKAITELNT